MTAAVEVIRGIWSGRAETAVILGSGLGEIADEVAAEAIIPYRDIPGFPRSTALAHQGRLVCGQLRGRPVIMLQGRCHLYEGYSLAEVTFPTRVLGALGVKTLVVTNAAGGINPLYDKGDVMLLDDHVSLMWFGGTQPLAPESERSPRPLTRLYDRRLIGLALAAARSAKFPLHLGVYIGVTGPSYETRAEYRAFRRLGGDCVGMSTVPEVLTATGLGMRVLATSTVTNVCLPDAPQTVTAEEVVEVARVARPKVQTVIEAVLADAT
ncbi:MAG: purine-nucleoside phosphorylase [Pirellulaceae bacterium]|nr:purine-nucleoside phosphorylase [Pirellulaceae bacterium]